MRSDSIFELLAIAVWTLLWIFGWGGFFWLFMYLKNRANQRRLEMIHQERMVAMEKGIPLPELPDLNTRPLKDPGTRNKNGSLAAGIVFASLGAGGMAALLFSPDAEMRPYWTLPLPLVFLGVGLLLYYYLTRDRAS
jgi:uncharacterized protein DUF6249